MEEMSIWVREATAASSRLVGQFVENLPALLGAALILLVGWLVARLARSAAHRFLNWLNGALDRRFGHIWARHLRVSTASVALFGNLVFWIIILVVVTAATRVLGLDAFSGWLNRVVAYLPTLVAGGLIVLVGFLISTLARELTSTTVATAGLPHAELFGRSVQVAILTTALVLGINQIGIDVTLLVTLIAIVFAAFVGSLSLAFALGARSFVANLIGAHYLKEQFQPGQVVRIGGLQGEILELTAVNVVLATEEGRVMVPAKTFNDEATSLLTEEKPDG